MNYCPTDIHRARSAAISFDLIMDELIPLRQVAWIKLQETIQPHVAGSGWRDYYYYDCYGPQRDLLITAYVCAGMHRTNVETIDKLVLQRRELINKLRSLRP